MTAPLRIVVVDDEPLAIERLEMLLARCADVELVGTAGSGEAALALIDACRPDLCLLDIAMPGLNGIDVARQLAARSTTPKVIFVTAFDNFAVAAFAIDAVDYLVKPVDPARLTAALTRARSRLGSLPAATAPGIEEFWASDQSGLRRIAASEVERITAERDYVRIHVGRRSWLLNDSMARLERGLDPARFVRVHRGAILNRDRVGGMRRDPQGWMVLMQDGTEQKVGRGHQDVVRAIRGRDV